MTPSFSDALRGLVGLRWVVLACLSVPLTVSAQTTYVPHARLTPYQIVFTQNLSSSTQCAQATAGGGLQAASCDSANNQQKFYVLNETADTDMVFQTLADGGERVRIVLAPSLDSVSTSTGQYNLLALLYSNVVGLDMNTTPNADLAHKWQISRAVGTPFVLPNIALASENQRFMVVGARNVLYGANGHYIEKTLYGFDPYVYQECSNYAFGGDPAPGVVKGCYLRSPPVPATKFQVRIANLAYPTGCMTPSTGTFALALCNTQDQSQTFTFKPTSYPGP